MGARITTAPTIRPFVEGDRLAVLDLWTRSRLTRPWNDPGKDIDRKMASDPAGFLVADAGAVVGTIMAGWDGHRGWLNYIAVDPGRRREGVGRSLVRAAEELLAARGCPKVNLQVRVANESTFGFYEALGYRRDDVVSFGRRFSSG